MIARSSGHKMSPTGDDGRILFGVFDWSRSKRRKGVVEYSDAEPSQDGKAPGVIIGVRNAARYHGNTRFGGNRSAYTVSTASANSRTDTSRRDVQDRREWITQGPSGIRGRLRPESREWDGS
jgi:hypothetical protein